MASPPAGKAVAERILAALESARWPELRRHSLRVARLALAVAETLDHGQPIELALAALAHDMGKIGWPPELRAKYPLTPMDWGLVRAHPVAAEEHLRRAWPAVPVDVLAWVQHHHERPGGRGYPFGIHTPSEEALIIAACDVYDATTSERAYRPGGALDTKQALLAVADFAPARVVAALGVVV